LDFLKRSLLLVNEHLKNSIQRRDRLKKQTLFTNHDTWQREIIFSPKLRTNAKSLSVRNGRGVHRTIMRHSQRLTVSFAQPCSGVTDGAAATTSPDRGK
ncbi:MAG: hypothetical protein RIS47_1818, partial [Bacteroidota bacterium]